MFTEYESNCSGNVGIVTVNKYNALYALLEVERFAKSEEL
jgi:hypothetical protein